MQAVFHPSQPNVQYPRYSSEHETKAAAEATDIQPANSQPFNQFNMTVQLDCFVAVCTNNHRYPFKSFLENQLWEIEILKHMQAARVVIIRMPSAQAWSFISVAEMCFRCSELTVQKSAKPSPALCRRTESLERRQMCSQITADQKWILDTTQLKDLELFCHAWKHFCQTVFGKFSQEYFKFFKQRSEMLKLYSPVSTVPRQQMSDQESWKGSVVRSHRHSALFSMSLINSISGKRNILCRLNMPQVLMQEPAD